MKHINSFSLYESKISLSTEPGTMNLWHGGNLDGNLDTIAHKSGRYEHGPGLYMTTHFDTAMKYAKGSRKLYLITIKEGNDLNDAKISTADAMAFIKTHISGSMRKVVIENMQRWLSEGSITGYIFNNILINHNALRPSKTDELKDFYVDLGIDYLTVNSPFGWGEKMIVLYNMKKIVNKTAVRSSDVEIYDLPTEFINNHGTY